MAVTTKQAAIDNLQAIAQLIVQSPEAQIQEIVNKVGSQLQQMLQVDQQQGDAITQHTQAIADIQQQLIELTQLGDVETQRVLELIAENVPEIANITLPTVTYRGADYSLADFVNIVSAQQGKKPVDYSEATYTPEGYLSSVLVRYDDGTQETITLTFTESEDGQKAIYIGQLPEAGGAADAFEWHVGITRLNSPLMGLSIARHSDMQVMRLIGTSHLINWGDSPTSENASNAPAPGDDINSSQGEPPSSTPDGLQDVPLNPLEGGFSANSANQTDAIGGGFVNFTVPNQGLYRVAVTNAVVAASYVVSAAGETPGSLVADSNGNAAGVIALQSGDVVSIATPAAGTPFTASIIELDQGLEPGDDSDEPPATR
ncbi:MAG: hypothetical protein AAF282_02165 [Cyanobacteria bacterium P01_A01_bin.15]